MSEVSIKDLDPAAVLAALNNASKPQGMGFLHFMPDDMGLDEARGLLARNNRFDYLNGRVMKVKIAGDTLNASLYDRDNGDGAAARVIADLRAKPVGD